MDSLHRRSGCRKFPAAHRDFCYDPEAIEGDFLIHPSSICLSCIIADFCKLPERQI
jgi:hypothetical protein